MITNFRSWAKMLQNGNISVGDSNLLRLSFFYKGAASRENLTSGFPTRSDRNQTAATKDSKGLENSDLGSRGIVLSV